MAQYKVEYSGGESRIHPGVAVDYMMVSVTVDDEDYTLYAEIDPADLCDESGNPAFDEDGEWNAACDDPERLSLPYLISAIREMCSEIDLGPSEIDFDGWDADDMPSYMMPGVAADTKIR